MQAATDFSSRAAIPFANAVRPCFLSKAQEEEFEMIVRLVRSSLWGCGVEHAWMSARSLSGLSHDPEAVMRCALADYEVSKAQRLADGTGLL
jgi:hypothetical protein